MRYILLVSLLMFSTFFNPAGAKEIIFYTTNEYPYQNKEGSGASLEIIKGIFSTFNKKSAPKVHFVPWKRAYNTVRSRKNTAIFTISRRKNREKYFDWCCSLYEATKNELFTLRGSGIFKLEDIEGKVGAVWRGDTSELILDSIKKKVKNVKKVSVNHFLQIVKMLVKKRVDFIVAKEPLLMSACYKEKLNCQDLMHVKANLEIPKNNLYIALNLNTDNSIREEFTKAFYKFKKTAEYKRILKKYSLHYID